MLKFLAKISGRKTVEEMKKQDSNFTGSIVGLGGLGCPALLALLESWPDEFNLKINLIDFDEVALSNLNRQILFTEADVGKSKVETGLGFIIHNSLAKESVTIFPVQEKVSLENIDDLLGDNDFVLDCSDDVSLKLMLNNYCLKNDKILVYAGAQGYEGLTFLVSKTGICIECVFGKLTADESCELGETCQSGGILGSIAGLTALTQTNILLSNLKSLSAQQNDCYFITKNAEIRMIQLEQSHTCGFHNAQ